MIYCTVCPVAAFDDKTEGELPRGRVMNVCVTLTPGSELFGVKEMNACPLLAVASAPADVLDKGTWRATAVPCNGNPVREPGCTGIA